MSLFTTTFTDMYGDLHTNAICTVSFVFRGEWENRGNDGTPSDGATTVIYHVHFWPSEQDRVDGINGQDYQTHAGNTLTLPGDTSGKFEALAGRCQAHFLSDVVTRIPDGVPPQ